MRAPPSLVASHNINYSGHKMEKDGGLTSQANSVLQDIEVFRPPKLWAQGAASRFDALGKLKIRLTIPVVLLETASQDDTSVLVSREDIRRLVFDSHRGSNIQPLDWGLRALHEHYLAAGGKYLLVVNIAQVSSSKPSTVKVRLRPWKQFEKLAQ